MPCSSRKLFVIIASLMMASGFVGAQASITRTTGQDSSNIGGGVGLTGGKGTDESTAFEISETDAERISRETLSDRNWRLEEITDDQEYGYYRLYFSLSNPRGEARVRVDASSGEVFEVAKKVKTSKEDSVAGKEEERNQSEDQIQNMEEARRVIAELRSENRYLKERLADTENKTQKNRSTNNTEVYRKDEVDEDRDNKTEVDKANNYSNKGSLQNSTSRAQNRRGNIAQGQNKGFFTRIFEGLFG